jgi:hypothetical protein
MELVPVKENSQRWKALYSKMARGQKADINDEDIQRLSVEGIAPNLTGLGGRLLAPKEAENVIPPPEEPAEIPLTYEEAVAMRARYRPQKRGKRVTKKRTTTKRRKPAQKKRKPQSRGKGKTRKRVRITKR